MKCDKKIMKLFFPSLMCATNIDCLHLTFDDGPHPIATPAVLRILKARNIQATFFLVGKNVELYPDIAKEITYEGHQIGNHTFNHSNLLFKNKNHIQKEIVNANDIIKSTLKIKPKHFRPPYGYFNRTVINVAKQNELRCVLWSENSLDFKINQLKNIRNRIVSKANNGDILLFHDNHLTYYTINSYLPKLLDDLLEKKFIFHHLPL